VMINICNKQKKKKEYLIHLSTNTSGIILTKIPEPVSDFITKSHQ